MSLKTYALSMVAVFSMSMALSAQAEEETAKADAHPGMALHEENCAACHMRAHDEAFYTRPDRKMESLKQLQGMVRMCDANLGTQLFDEDMEQIADYLNTAFYKFTDGATEK